MPMIAVLDVGGTSIKTGAVGAFGAIEGPTLPTLADASAEVILTQLATAVELALGLADADAVGLAIAFPGPFDLVSGTAMISGLGKFDSIFHVVLRPEIQARTTIGSRSIVFVRDNEAAGVGEAVFGVGRGFDRCLTVMLGTGVGMCLTDHGVAIPEISDLAIERLALRRTPWGRADDVLSARGLAARLGVGAAGLRSTITDPASADTVADHGRRLGTFLVPVVEELAADGVVIGGGIVSAFGLFGPSLQLALGTTPCVPASLGARGPILGAVRLAFPDLSLGPPPPTPVVR